MRQVPPQHFEPVPHWVSAVQLWQVNWLQRLLKQSELAQHDPVSQVALPPASAPPPQQTLFAPHSVLVVHDWQDPWKQTCPPLQSVEAQQLPGEQRPLQQRLPEPHWLSAVQAEHWPETQTSPVVQSAAVQQLPTRQTSAPIPPSTPAEAQHLSPGPQSESTAQLVQELPSQTCPPLQVEPLQHDPRSHTPLQQTELAPHWV